MNLTEIKNSTFEELSQFMPESELLVTNSAPRGRGVAPIHSKGSYFSEDNVSLSRKLKMAAYEKYWQQNPSQNLGYSIVEANSRLGAAY